MKNYKDTETEHKQEIACNHIPEERMSSYLEKENKLQHNTVGQEGTKNVKSGDLASQLLESAWLKKR